MPGKKRNPILLKFLLWRTKHVTHQQFLMVLAAVVGFLAGLVAVVIKNLTAFIQRLLEDELIANYHDAFYFIFPLLGLGLTVFIIKFVVRNKIGNGIPTTLHAISQRKGLMQRFQVYASILTAPITAGFGGSVGLEGPTVATGAALSSNLSRLFKMNQATRTLLIGCAAAGAMSSMFKAPIAAIIFAIEIFALDLTLVSMIPLLLASVSAILTSYFFFGNDIILHHTLTDEFDITDVPFFILLGVVASFCSIYFTRIYIRLTAKFEKLGSQFFRLLVGGAGLGILIFFIPPLYGEGYDVINNLLKGNYINALGSNIFNDYLHNIWVVVAMLAGLVVFKIIATAFTIGGGGVGGIFAPVLFMGSAMGHCFALIFNHLGILNSPLSTSNFTLVGMAGLMAGIMHAPLTAIFLIAELTRGYDLYVPLMITAAISYAITNQVQPHSIFNLDLASRGEKITHNKDQTVLTMLNINQVIEKNFVPLNINMTLGDVIKEGVVKSSRNIFPVIDDEQCFKGIILLDDLRPIMFQQHLYDEVKVSDIMQTAPEIIHLERDKMNQIMNKFQQTTAWNLPVVREDRYVGFVSKSKLLTAYRQKLIDVTV